MKKPAPFALVAGINSSGVQSGAINAAFLLILTGCYRSPPKELVIVSGLMLPAACYGEH